MADFNFSVFADAAVTHVPGTALVGVLDNAIRATDQVPRWKVAIGDFWCTVNPEEGMARAQGWKLHLSATPGSAEKVLTRSLPVLLEGRSAFKFARSTAHLAQLNGRNTLRGHSGKFITVYPDSDDEAVRLAEALHQATAGLPGPRVLSDRPYAPESLVHYRYGAFVEERRLGNDGLYAWVIFDPEGNPVEDRRVGSYLPPSWASCPFPTPVSNGTADPKSGAGGVLIGDRFLAREAIRHTNKGGVYRTVDMRDGGDAIVKEARPHVDEDETGKDVRDMLRAEARALEIIGPLGVAPRLLSLFEQSGHLFLAEELVPGVPLRRWVLDRIRDGGWQRHVPEVGETVDRLVTLMDAAHEVGVVLRDFNPNNIMVRPDGELRLIDLELAVVAGDEGEKLTRAGTPGYVAPEQMVGTPAAFAADYYSLGATICFVVTGSTPSFLAEQPEPRPLRQRLDEWLSVRQATPDRPNLRTLVLGLMDDDPDRRWTTADARTALSAARKPAGGRLSSASAELDSDSGRLDDEQWSQAVEGVVGYLLATMDARNGERLWPGCGPCPAPTGRLIRAPSSSARQASSVYSPDVSSSPATTGFPEPPRADGSFSGCARTRHDPSVSTSAKRVSPGRCTRRVALSATNGSPSRGSRWPARCRSRRRTRTSPTVPPGSGSPSSGSGSARGTTSSPRAQASRPSSSSHPPPRNRWTHLGDARRIRLPSRRRALLRLRPWHRRRRLHPPRRGTRHRSVRLPRARHAGR